MILVTLSGIVIDLKAEHFVNVPASIIVKASDRVTFVRIVQLRYLQPIITQYFIGNKSEIWSLSLIVHSKG